MKSDPTKKIRARASRKSRERKDTKVFIDLVDGPYLLAGSQNDSTILVYKNGSEIAL